MAAPIWQEIWKGLEDYFKQGHTFNDFVFDTLKDHCQSQSLMWGMYGNVMMANFYKQMGIWLEEQQARIKKVIQ